MSNPVPTSAVEPEGGVESRVSQEDRALVEHFARWSLGEDATAHYEAEADAFRVATGMMAPGKSEPTEMCGGDEHDQERRLKWAAWCRARSTARARATLGLLSDVDRLAAELVDASHETQSLWDATTADRAKMVELSARVATVERERDAALLEARAYGNTLAREKNLDERIRRVKAIREETGCGLTEALGIVNGDVALAAMIGATLQQQIASLTTERDALAARIPAMEVRIAELEALAKRHVDVTDSKIDMRPQFVDLREWTDAPTNPNRAGRTTT